ncbi:MAG: 50S ribosomal protein L4, partial [Nitrososphaerota archaeon]|nr:50S ribosomal protein L4 [Nitrososphaerota archaeon]
RTGKAKWRGRSKRVGAGPLFVFAEDDGITMASGGIPGVDAVKVDSLSVLDLAPGGEPGRLCIFSESAVKSLAEGEMVKVEA